MNEGNGVSRMQHDAHFDLDTKDTLTKEDVADSVINEVTGGLTGVDHETVGELHRLSTGSTKLAGDNDLATFSPRLHDETKNTITRPTCANQLISMVGKARSDSEA